MSHYETPEQRQIRELRSQIASMTREADKQASKNNALRKELGKVKQQQQKENARLKDQMNHLAADAKKKQDQMSAAMRNLDNQVKERERLQNQRIHAMQTQHDTQMHQLEAEFQTEQQGLKNEISQTRSEMNRGLTQLRENTDKKLQKQREEIQNNISNVSAALQGQINDVNSNVNSLVQAIAAKDQGKKELAEYWAQEAARLLRQIRESFREQLLDQKSVANLERKIEQANNDIKGGIYESSIVSGRDAFFAALDMKGELTAIELEWNYSYNAVKSRETQLLQDLESAENRVYEFEADGEKIEYSNGIDYWTFGQLTVFRNELSKLRNSIENVDSMTIAELQAVEEQLRSLQEQLAMVENAAHINVAMSVSRQEAAVKIGSILDSDYQMIDSDGGFFDGEDREEYHAVFQNPTTHDQVAVVITPIPDEAGIVTNHIELIVGNSDNNPVTRDRMACAVAEKLRISGVQGCSFPCSGRFGDATLQEMARVGDIAAVDAGDEKARASLPEGVIRTDNITSRVTRRI